VMNNRVDTITTSRYFIGYELPGFFIIVYSSYYICSIRQGKSKIMYYFSETVMFGFDSTQLLVELHLLTYTEMIHQNN